MKKEGDTLTAIITTVLYGVLSAIVIFLMKCETNKRLKSNQPENIENTNIEDTDIVNQSVKPYQPSATMYICMAVLVAISALCGFIVSNHAVSVIAIIEIGACYLATLGAAVIDLKTRTIPNYIPLALIGIRLVIFVFEMIYVDYAISYLISSLIGCFLCGLVLIIANRVSKGGIGGGDIKLLSSIGFMCGIYVVFSGLLLALICCIIVSGVLMVLKKQKSKDHLPFGPFIYVGFVIMCLFTLY